MEAIHDLNAEQIRSKLITMRDKINVLQWDEKLGQINPYKKVQLDKLRKEFRELEERLNTLALPQ